MSAIEVTGVSKSFWIPSVRRDTIREHVLSFMRPRQFERLDVLDSVSFNVRPGEALGIMGRNGSGKSTLLKIMCGIYQADRGQVRIGASVTPLLELGIGWNLELDAIDNVLLIGTVMGLTLREVRASLDEILAFAELERFANTKVKHYSSGMMSRLAYAVGFHAVKDVLVLDEIFAVGDAGFRERCEERYRELRALGHTIVMVSHMPSIIADFCDRALLLERGRIDMEGCPGDVARRYQSMLTRPHTTSS
jgi:ABC-type polysaccharide/polyol phosphate transport system ATPase subunit